MTLAEELQIIATCSMCRASFRSNLDNPPGYMVNEIPHVLPRFTDLKSDDLLAMRPDAVELNPLAWEENRQKQEVSEMLMRFDREVIRGRI